MVLSSSTVGDETLVILIAACTLVSYSIYLGWWNIVPSLFYPEEQRLEKRIAQIRAEAERCAGSDSLHLHGKLCREAQRLVKELARVREQRVEPYRFYRQQKLQQKGGSGGKDDVLQYCIAQMRYILPRLVGAFIVCGFMIPTVYLYGSHTTVVVFSQEFINGLVLVKHWVESLGLMWLLRPFVWGLFIVEGELCNAGRLAHASRGGSGGFSSSTKPDTSVTEDVWDGSVSPSASTGASVANKVCGIGVVPWFLACLVAVRFTHRVLSRA